MMDAAMSPDSGGQVYVSSEPHANIPIANIDVKKRNFMKAINFETLQTNNGGTDTAEDSVDSDDLEEQSLVSDVTSDLLEQQQAQEQTRLLDRFKQLRDWQAQQQEQLMKRQEQQLAQFHSEQEKLQQLILRQRNAHWGSNPTPPQHNGVLSNGRQHDQSEKTSSRTKLESQLPHAIAGSTLMLARCQQDIIQQMATPTKTRKRPRRHSVSSLSTQEDFIDADEEHMRNNVDCNNCNKVATHTNGSDTYDAPTTSTGLGRTTVLEVVSSHALRHSSHTPLHTQLDMSVTGHGLLPMDVSMANTNRTMQGSDDGSDDDSDDVTVNESVIVPFTNNAWMRRCINESVQCSMQEDPVMRRSEGTEMDPNAAWVSHAVATQYTSPGRQRSSLHRHRNHDRIVGYNRGCHNEHNDRGHVAHTLRVSDEGTNTERQDDVPIRSRCGETSGSESDASTRRVLFPDSSTRPHEYSPSTRLPFHRPQFDNFSETGSYSPPREQRAQNKTMDRRERECDAPTGRNDRAMWERECIAPTERDSQAAFNICLESDARGRGKKLPQWATDMGKPGRKGAREGWMVGAEDSEWQPMSPPKAPDERPIRGTQKSFEQLLEEKLMTATKDGEKSKQVPTVRNFLRRGSGRPRYCASKDKMRQLSQVEEKSVRPMVAALLGAEPSARETRLLGESQIIDGPNVKDEPSPPEPKPPVQTVTAPPVVKKSPQVMPPPKQATLTTTVSPKSVSPKSVSPKSTSAKSALPMMVPPEKEVKPKVKGKEKSPPKDKGQGNVLAEVTQKEVKPKVKGKEKSPPKDKGQGNVLAEAFEQDELDEFELLEQFAEDDASFLSSVSAVDKVLQQKKATQGQPSQPPPDKSKTVSRFSAANSSKQCSRKSSTSGEYDNVSYFTQASVDAAAGKAVTKQVRKVARIDRRAGPSEKHISVLYFGKAPVVKETKATSTLGAQTEPEPEDIGAVSCSESFEETCELDMENLEEIQNSDLNFADDVKSWDTIYETEAMTQTSDPKLTPRERRRQQKGPSPPPTSTLVTKLFPDLKAKKAMAQTQEKEEQEKRLEAAKQAEMTKVSLQSKELRVRLLALEAEIEQFRHENAALEKLRQDREEGLEHLKREMAEFEKQKAEEMAKLQEFKSEEIKKLKRERKLFEQHQKVTRAMADKEQREEIDRLRQQLADLKEEMKKKEQRSFANTARLRERLETLELENQELKTEIRLMEQKRLEEWQRREVAASTATAAMTAMSKHSGKRLESKGCQVTEQPVQVQPVQVQPEPMTQVHRDVTLRLSGAAPDAPEPMDDSSEATPQVMHPSHKPSKHDSATTDSGSIDQSADVPRKVAGGPAVMTIIDTKDKTYEEVVHDDGKVERIYSNNAREILFANGTRKQISADGRSVVVWFFNGDIKQMMPDHRVVYYYADAKTTHTSYSDGLEILHFATGQTEKHYPDGTREITFPDQTIKYLFPNGTEESIFVDGTVIRIDKVGNKTMEFPNGQREVHTADFKRREYPDGTTKTVFPDGRQETLYSSGRFRVKDKEGNVIVDKRVPTLETCPG